MSEDDKRPEAYEGVGRPLFEDDQAWAEHCCGGCGHSLRCKAGGCCFVGDCYPCDVEVTADALRAALADLPAGIALGALRAVADPLGHDVVLKDDGA
jgi:hypothetical protein